jgi:integrase
VTPLDAAIQVALKTHWRGTRRYALMVSWTNSLNAALPGKCLEDITSEDVEAWREAMTDAPATIYARVGVLSVIYKVARGRGYKGPVPEFQRPRVPKPLKWWLNPEQQPKVISWLRASNTAHREASLLVDWTVSTGLRIEESLRTQRQHFHGLGTCAPWITVPGTKTDDAQATLPLSAYAAGLASRLLGVEGGQRTPLFTITYREMWADWDACRKVMGFNASTATLKALRRSYAHARAAKGCPLPLLQQLMRHKSAATTMGYLKLTGGQFTDAELRRFV